MLFFRQILLILIDSSTGARVAQTTSKPVKKSSSNVDISDLLAATSTIGFNRCSLTNEASATLAAKHNKLKALI